MISTPFIMGAQRTIMMFARKSAVRGILDSYFSEIRKLKPRGSHFRPPMDVVERALPTVRGPGIQTALRSRPPRPVPGQHPAHARFLEKNRACTGTADGLTRVTSLAG